jgi:hypothetical protein
MGEKKGRLIVIRDNMSCLGHFYPIAMSVARHAFACDDAKSIVCKVMTPLRDSAGGMRIRPNGDAFMRGSRIWLGLIRSMHGASPMCLPEALHVTAVGEMSRVRVSLVFSSRKKETLKFMAQLKPRSIFASTGCG